MIYLSEMAISIAKCWITSRYPNKTGMSANQPASLPACRCHIAEIHQPTGAKLRNDDQNTMCLDILYWNLYKWLYMIGTYIYIYMYIYIYTHTYI